VPSYHYDPVFGRIVHDLFASTRPAVVALELPPSFRSALEWAASCWPRPVAAVERRRGALGVVVPFVPGDSILEAFRLATRANIEVALIDLDVPGEPRLTRAVTVGPEFAARPGDGFFAAIDALNDRQPPLVSDLAREAAMAAALAALMGEHESVVWVGGFAHWSRIIERLRATDFSSPDVEPVPRRRFARARLGASALVRLTGVYPAVSTAFAQAPTRFEPFDAMRQLLHDAAATGDADGAPEVAAPIDLARTGLYARNLAATDRIGEQPQLAELVLAASTTIGPRYASRLYALATAEPQAAPGAALEPLTFEVDPRTAESETVEAGFCFRGQRLSAEPWFPVPWPILEPPDVVRLTREAGEAEWERLPEARRGEKYAWHAYPPDQQAYEGFVRYALRRASQLDPVDGPSEPFVSGLEGGLDVRTTIRFWHEDRLYVRRRGEPPTAIRNGVIDWTNRTENSELLRGRRRDAGWNDPDSRVIGSVSLEIGHDTISRHGESEVTRRRREWSFVTVDHPTFETRGGSGALWDRVIEPLVDLEKGRDNLYGWLKLAFSFCEGKPFVYYSQYTPSARIFTLARAHRVRLRWCPLGHLSAALVARHRAWHQLWLSDSQWRALQARLENRGRNDNGPMRPVVTLGRQGSVGHPRGRWMASIRS
jgi:hypothetical protein